MKQKKRTFDKLKLTICVLILFSLSLILLLTIPTAISLAQNRVFVLADTKMESHNIAPQVVIQRAPVLKITDLGILPPKFSSEAVLAKDLDTGQIIYQKNADVQLSPASTTKLLTALVAIEHYKTDEILQVYPEDIVGGSSMGLNVNDKLTFRSLLYGMLLNSGNDAAFTIASNYPGGLPMFVLQMNKKAQALGLQDSHFQNPAGFDNPDHFSSAKDLSKIASIVAINPDLQRVVATKETSVVSFDSTRIYYLKNLNKHHHYIICGDFNIAHKPIDLKNWRANQKHSGFLPEERQWLDQLFDELGFVDAFRLVNQEAEQYTWWSHRGRAWEKNVGWRIDYHVITPGLKPTVKSAFIYKDQRFSDHAPLGLEYDIILG